MTQEGGLDALVRFLVVSLKSYSGTKVVKLQMMAFQ